MNILFVFAHPDDEAFGPAGTIARLSAEGNIVTVISMCNGARPGNEHVAASRQNAFIRSCDILGASGTMLNNNDLSLKYNDTCSNLIDLVNTTRPDIVYTHSGGDLNMDHRLVFDACLVACRPKPECSVTSLISCESTASTDWAFAQVEPRFTPNMYVNVDDYVDLKRQALSCYKTETYPYPDARSIKAAITRTQFRGSQVGFNHAEAFQTVLHRW